MKIKKFRLTNLTLLKLYTVIALINIGYFGIVGIKTGKDKLTIKKETYSQMETIQKDLQKKRNDLATIENNINQTTAQIQKLHKAIPSEEDLDEYLVELMQGAAKQGFVVDMVRVTDKDEQSKRLSVKLMGTEVEKIPDLVETIESLARLTTVESINTSLKDYKVDVQAVLYVFEYNAKEDI